MDRQATLAADTAAQALLRQAFGIWTTYERGRLLDRVREQRHVRSALHQWKAAAASIRQGEQQADAVRATADRRLQGEILVCIRAAFVARTRSQRHAEAADKSRLLLSAFGRWRARRIRIKEDEKHADAARAFFVQHTALTVWKVELAKQRQQRFVLAKEEDLKRQILDGMCDRAACPLRRARKRGAER